ncbi:MULTISPECIES: hypothetical protein [unclassified Nostoc]|uniref:hypothetical protein n=1 Tax=unclassified Nostoc TaxID=2593658 RepID=UPI002AD58A56|nr:MULTISPECIES: hypothetical protein [unclassified Nostoc]MDZ8124722.1 hypothetical protein [Nostoc sp. CmiVER01]MDZ8222708.1 hypothetical protein [Nostoc sp. ChiVER01]
MKRMLAGRYISCFTTVHYCYVKTGVSISNQSWWASSSKMDSWALGEDTSPQSMDSRSLSTLVMNLAKFTITSIQ